MKQSELRSLIREQVKTIIKEANELSSYKIGDEVKFSNGEVWKVTKPGVKGDKIFLAPFNSIAKKGHISLAIEFTADELKDTVTESVTESVLKEVEDVKSESISRLAAFFGVSPSSLQKFNFDGKDNIKELTNALNASSYEGAEAYYKVAIEMAKKDLGIEESLNEADDPEAGEAAPYGSGYSEVNEDAGMVIDVAMGVAVGLMGLWALIQSAPLVGRVFGDAAEYLANKSEKKAKLALKNQRKETIAPIIAKFKNDTQLADMYQALTPYADAENLGYGQAALNAYKGRKNQLIKIGNYIKSKLTPEELVYFRDISAMLRDGDIK